MVCVCGVCVWCVQMEVERALLEGEQVSEMALLQREKEVLDQLNEKIGSTDKTALAEKSQVSAADVVQP